MHNVETLKFGTLEITGQLIDASNSTFQGKIDNEFVIYKPIQGEVPLWDFPDGKLAWREVASYRVSHALGLDVVPPTILRGGPLGEGMVQAWVECDESVDIVQIAQSDHQEIRKIAFLDILINNGDRKFGHVLPMSTQEVFACDHGVTFNSDYRLRTVLWQFMNLPFSSTEIAALGELTNQLTEGLLDGLITVQEIEHTHQRIRVLQENPFFPEPRPEWPAVPWPLF